VVYGEYCVTNIINSKRKNVKNNTEAGFTLVELLVVLAIIGLIAGLVGPQVLRYMGKARVDTTKAQMKNIAASLELYYLDSGQYPETEAGLSVLTSSPNDGTIWNGPYLKSDAALKDAWGHQFVYQRISEPAAIVIMSLGRDGKPQGEGLDADLEYKVQ
jgi:general secretion pathway protein G